jgi:hypothetical protein
MAGRVHPPTASLPGRASRLEEGGPGRRSRHSAGVLLSVFGSACSLHRLSELGRPVPT